MSGATTGTIQLTVAQEPAVAARNPGDDGIRSSVDDGTCTASLRGSMASGDD